ncbi:glycoside hydrolase family 16 protein [Acetobacterium wieringae]|uniref:glycoside hydrolase family 16 protein n=1 Tax=Acetobacterium wieringae TaxID=52694 RepID=UPI0026F231DE|nr:glycoside hydrolase family 16 protein [Acetobacterium wieringae]
MKKSLVIFIIFLGCLLIGMMLFIARVNQPKSDDREGKMNQENFDNLDENIWAISSKTLGRTLLNPENVMVKDDFLNIRMPANTLSGGEIASREAVSYGSYESRMKLPDAPSSITGFFLYAPPDYFYEIDIEIHNTKEGKILLTTYADGEVQNEYVGDLGFDPTADFHHYRFDYTEDQVAFYVDNKFIKKWQDGFPRGQPMQLMVNTWYPNWLSGTPTPEDQVLLVDWIRY